MPVVSEQRRDSFVRLLRDRRLRLQFKDEFLVHIFNVEVTPRDPPTPIPISALQSLAPASCADLSRSRARGAAACDPSPLSPWFVVVVSRAARLAGSTRHRRLVYAANHAHPCNARTMAPCTIPSHGSHAIPKTTATITRATTTCNRWWAAARSAPSRRQAACGSKSSSCDAKRQSSSGRLARSLASLAA